MVEINIQKEGHWCYNFRLGRDDIPFYYNNVERCSYCNEDLDYIYSYIIGSLREAGLLSEEYIPACCYCQTLTKLGLGELMERCSGISYSPFDDILYINIIGGGYNGFFRIHDASKVLKD